MWAIKPQEVVDGHSGLTLTFGEQNDDSNTVSLTLSFKGVGSLLTFQRGGELLKITPVTPLTDEQKDKLASVDDRVAGEKVAAPDLSVPAGSTPVVAPEPYQENPHAKGIAVPVSEDSGRLADAPPVLTQPGMGGKE